MSADEGLDTAHRWTVLFACQRGGCVLLAEVWLQRGLAIEEIRARIAVLEEIRLHHPYFANYDEGAQMIVRDFPPAEARALAADIARSEPRPPSPERTSHATPQQ